MPPSLPLLGGSNTPSPTSLLLATALGATLTYLLSHPPPSPPLSRTIIPAPKPPSSTSSHPYPPSILPGRRLVPTPFGTVHVYEFGPSQGEKVLLLPGIGTPVLCLGDLALSLSERGYRVLMFDYFGRGYSDFPTGVDFGSELYITQILMVLASSSLPWTGDSAYHLLGYSLGGGLAVAFARWCPSMLRSLTLVASGGLIRRDKHVGWRSRLLYSTGWLPERLLESLVERRIRPDRAAGGREDSIEKEGREVTLKGGKGDHDANGGSDWDSALLSKRGSKTTVADVMEWQVREHGGFVKSFMSTIRHAPIYDQWELWGALGRELEVRRGDKGVPGLKGGKVLLVLGERDSVIVMEELVEDAKAALGEEAVEVVAVDAGHELVFTHGDEVAEAAIGFWRSRG